MTRTQLVDVNADTPFERIAREVFFAYCATVFYFGVIAVVVA
jgi:hypothetical protein